MDSTLSALPVMSFPTLSEFQIKGIHSKNDKSESENRMGILKPEDRRKKSNEKMWGEDEEGRAVE